MEPDARKEMILDGAQALFAEKGVKGTTIGDIAAKIGIGKPILYQFFASKDEILEAVILREIEKLKQSLKQRISDQEDPLIKMAKMWENALEYYEQDDFLIHILRGNEVGLPPYMHTRYVMEIETFVVGLLEGLFQEAIAKGLFVQVNSRIAAYLSYRIYQAATYGRTDTVKGYTTQQIMRRILEIMSVGLITQPVDLKAILLGTKDDEAPPAKPKGPAA